MSSSNPTIPPASEADREIDLAKRYGVLSDWLGTDAYERVAIRRCASAEADVRTLLESVGAVLQRINAMAEGDHRWQWKDWACRECDPNSDILADGFQCHRHEAATLHAALSAKYRTEDTRNG